MLLVEKSGDYSVAFLPLTSHLQPQKVTDIHSYFSCPELGPHRLSWHLQSGFCTPECSPRKWDSIQGPQVLPELALADLTSARPGLHSTISTHCTLWGSHTPGYLLLPGLCHSPHTPLTLQLVSPSPEPPGGLCGARAGPRAGTGPLTC